MKRNGPYQAGQPGGQNVTTKLRKFANPAGFGEDRLKASVRRKQSADF